MVQIPEKSLDEPGRPRSPQRAAQADVENTISAVASPLDTPFGSDDEDRDGCTSILKTEQRPDLERPRRLSSDESVDGVMRLESDIVGGSA